MTKWTLCFLSSALALSVAASGDHPTITTFDVPGAATSAGKGTFAVAINPAGTITGYFLDAGKVHHGFLRDRGGAVTTIDVPGAGTGVDQGTTPQSINPAAAVTGYYADAGGVPHGFLRAPD